MHKMEHQPWVDNYPSLSEWLKKHEARCDWQLALGGSKDAPNASVEQWRFRNGAICIVTVHANKIGWDIFTPSESLAIDATLLDAETRCRLESK